MNIRIALLTGCLLVSACVSPSSAPPPKQQAELPKPTPVPAAPPPAPTPTKPSGEWIDWPITPGTWAYRTDERGSLALFGPANANAKLTLRCDRSRGRVFLSVAGSTGQNFTIRTGSAMKSFAATPSSGTPAYLAAEIMPGDPILDAMAYSRGRFAIEVGGLGAMAIPNWNEIGRVIEDCRN